MSETLSQAEWDAIEEDHKAIEPDGQRYVLRTDADGKMRIVPVEVKPRRPQKDPGRLSPKRPGDARS